MRLIDMKTALVSKMGKPVTYDLSLTKTSPPQFQVSIRIYCSTNIMVAAFLG